MTLEPVSIPVLLEVDIGDELEVDVLGADEYELEVKQEIIVQRYEEGTYNGPYDVVPDVCEQTLQTENKVLRKNVVIKEVPMSLASSLQINKLF